MSDLYRIHQELYAITEETEFTEFRDGHPFTYPAVILKEVDSGKTKVVPKFSLDRLAKRVPVSLVEVDSFEEFKNCFELATQGKFTQAINSYSSDRYEKYRSAISINVENYNKGFQNENLSKESKQLLESFAMMLLVSVEMFSVEKKDALSANKTE